jgi:DNA (cytosine-5)-methyltransferase 1
MQTRKPRLGFVSLFSGCGGLDLGFTQAGFSCLAAYDLDRFAVETHRLNFGSISESCDLSQRSINPPQHVAVLVAGPPCQGFSTAGLRKFDDPRNALLTAAGEMALRIKPSVVLIENVAGAKAGEHRAYWDRLCNMLKSGGYRTAVNQCEAHEFGVAQTRKRLILVAWKGRREFRFPPPDGSKPTLAKALEGIEDARDHAPDTLPPESELSRIASRIKPGQKLSNVRGGAASVHTWDLPDVFGYTSAKEKEILRAVMKLRRQERKRDNGDADPVSLSSLSDFLGFPVERDADRLVRKCFLRYSGADIDLTHTFNGKFRRLVWDGLALTVDTRFGDPRYFLHPDQNRGFSFREAARIQGFPDSFTFAGSRSDKFRLIGNAVPPPVAKCLATAIRGQLLHE